MNVLGTDTESPVMGCLKSNDIAAPSPGKTDQRDRMVNPRWNWDAALFFAVLALCLAVVVVTLEARTWRARLTSLEREMEIRRQEARTWANWSNFWHHRLESEEKSKQGLTQQATQSLPKR